MSDIGGAVKQIATEVKQNVAQPLGSEIKQDLELTGQSVFGTPQTKSSNTNIQPTVDPQNKAEEEARKKAAWQRIQQWNTNLQNAQAEVRAEIKQQEESRKKDAEEKNKIEQYKVIEEQQTQNDLASQVKEAQTKSETRKGVGG